MKWILLMFVFIGSVNIAQADEGLPAKLNKGGQAASTKATYQQYFACYSKIYSFRHVSNDKHSLTPPDGPVIVTELGFTKVCAKDQNNLKPATYHLSAKGYIKLFDGHDIQLSGEEKKRAVGQLKNYANNKPIVGGEEDRLNCVTKVVVNDWIKRFNEKLQDYLVDKAAKAKHAPGSQYLNEKELAQLKDGICTCAQAQLVDDNIDKIVSSFLEAQEAAVRESKESGGDDIELKVQLPNQEPRALVAADLSC